MRRLRLSQQVIVVLIFVVMFAGFALFLPGFLSGLNMVALLQNVAILGILGLGMSLIVLGRGIDLSMVAMLAVPPSQMPLAPAEIVPELAMPLEKTEIVTKALSLKAPP